MLESETKIDELLSQLSQDKQFISERQKDRQERYKKSTQVFLKSIKKEMEIIEKTKDSNFKRNKEFQTQIKDLYTRYQSSSTHLSHTFRKTTNAKIKFNDDILNFYPRLLRDQSTSIENNIDELKNRLEELKTINEREKYDYYKILEKKYDGFSYQEEVKEERERLEQELNETKKFLRSSNSQANQQQFQQQPNKQQQQQYFAKSQPQFLQQYDAKYFGNQNQENDQAFRQTAQSNQMKQRNQSQTNFNDIQNQPPQPQQQQNPYKQNVKNVQMYAGINQQQNQEPIPFLKEEALDILNQFTKPDLSKKNRMNNYRPVQLTNKNYSENNSAAHDGNIQELQNDNAFSVQKVPYQGGFRNSRAMSKETFPESTEKQSSQPSEQREDYINRNLQRNQEYQ